MNNTNQKNSLYLVMVDPNANNNKYYKMIPNGNMFEVQYGRVGVSGFQTKTYNMSQWDSTLKSKLKKGYVDKTDLVAETVVKSNKKEYAEIANPFISQIVNRLQTMAKKAIEENYTISSNKVTKVMITEAQYALNNLINADSIENFNEILVELFKIIPRKMGKVKDYLAKTTNDFGKILDREQDLLDVMKGQVIQHTIVEKEIEEDTSVAKFTILDAMELVFEELNDADISIIKKSCGTNSHKFIRGWKVINLRTQTRFDNFVKENNINERKLLFHGTRGCNVWSIINMGLVLRPNAIRTGSMFGSSAIYFSNDFDKSRGYTDVMGSRWANGEQDTGFMMLMDVAYGKPYDVYSFDSKYYNMNYENLQKVCKGANCLHAHGGTGMLRKDEIVVFLEDQTTIQYLIEVK